MLKNNEREIDYKRVVSIPYYGDLSCEIKRELKDYIKTSFQKHFKIG